MRPACSHMIGWRHHVHQAVALNVLAFLQRLVDVKFKTAFKSRSLCFTKTSPGILCRWQYPLDHPRFL